MQKTHPYQCYKTCAVPLITLNVRVTGGKYLETYLFQSQGESLLMYAYHMSAEGKDVPLKVPRVYPEYMHVPLWLL